MNNRAKYDREHSKTPKEFLEKSRLTTEPIGGGVEYDDKGELVEYDVALEALEMCKEEFGTLLDKWEKHAINGMQEGATAYHQGKIALICDLRDWIKTL